MSNNVYLHGSFDSLRQYGINFLTGESCAYSLRGLCDLSEKGVELLNGYFGGNLTFERGSQWNSRVGDDPAVASVMLSHDIIRSLSIYIMMHVENKHYIVSYGNGTVAGTDDIELVRLAQKTQQGGDVHVITNMAWRGGSHPNIGGRNVHAFTGRST